MKKKYWILLCSLLIITGINVRLQAQTVANYTDSFLCYGDQTKFNSISTSTYPIVSYNWDLNNDSIFNDDTGVVIKYLFSYADTFRIGLQVISTNDTSILYKNIIIQLLTPFFTVNADSQCLAGNSYGFTNITTLFPSGTFTNEWFFDDGGTSLLKNPFHSYSQHGKTYRVKLVATSNYGCKDSSFENVTVLPNPKVSFSILDTLNCIGENFQFTNKSSIAYGTMQNLWDYGDGNQSNTTNAAPSYAAVGKYLVTLKVTSNKGCSDSMISNVTVDSNLIAVFSISPNDTQCFKSHNFVFTSVSNVCGIMDSILWDLNGDGIFGDQKGITVNKTYLTPQSVKIGMIVYSGIHSDTAFHTIVINASPTASFSINNPTQFLSGNNFAFTNNSLPATTLSYNWNFGDGNSSTAKSPAWSYLTVGVFRVLLTVTSNKGCIDTISKTATVTNPLNADFTADSACFNDSTSFNNTTTSVYPVLQVNWDFNNDSIFTDASGNKVKHLFSSPGTYTVGLQIVTATLTDTIFKKVIVYSRPVAGYTINTATQNLVGNNFVFTNTSTISPSGTLSYLWDFKDATTSTLKDDSHSYTAAGIYNVLLTVTSQFGCKDTISKKATVLGVTALKADFKTDTICFPGIATFTNTSTSSDPILQYKWDLDDNGVFDNGSGQIIKYPLVINGNFTAGLQVITAYDTSVIYKMVTVNPKPSADFSINRSSQPLPGNNFIFLNCSKISPYSTMTFDWALGDGGISSAIDVYHSYAALGTYNVRIIAISDKGCRDTTTKQVNVVNYLLTVNFNANNTCFGDTTFFQNLSSVTNDSIINYSWNFGDGSPAIIWDNPEHIYSDTGIYQITLKALLLSGNKDSIVKSITVYPNPVATINSSPGAIVYIGQTVTLSVSGTFDSMLWSTKEITSSIIVTTSGIYSVRVYDSIGCTDSAYTEIVVLPKTAIQVTTAFTPNGDGINDYWKIINIGAYGNCDVKIYNRYGDMMFESSNYKNDWDGKRNGKTLPEGTYYYLINTPKDGSFTGSVNILK
jgi:gliding motility-associated-like protein